MIFLQLATIILLFGIVQNQDLIPSVNSERLEQKVNSFITNAYPTHRWPWHVAVYHILDCGSHIYKCGGTLINSRSILTAAHCVVGDNGPLNGKQVSVSLGRWNLYPSDSSAQSIEVSEIVAHEKYNSTNLSNDIAIIKLSAEAVFNSYVQPICLWKKDKIDLREVIGKSGTVIGFGLTETGHLSSVLRKASLPVIDTAVCRRMSPNYLLSGTNFCAGHRNGTLVCNGDSGGSMSFQETDGQYYVRGIVSFGTTLQDPNTNASFCDSTEYAVFTDVAQYLPWIRTNWARCERKIQCMQEYLGSRISAHYCIVYIDETLCAQDCDIIIDEAPHIAVAVKGLQNVGKSDFIPMFVNAVTKFENLETLQIIGIQLKNVVRSRLSVFWMIKGLSLAINEITQLDAGTFDDLTNLVELDVQKNRLKELHVDLFKELRNLNFLWLHNNEIETLPDDIFRYNTKLVSILLHGNQFKAINADAVFKELRYLHTLFLFGARNELSQQAVMRAASNRPLFRPMRMPPVLSDRFEPPYRPVVPYPMHYK